MVAQKIEIDVIWLSTRKEIEPRGYWDQALIDDILSNNIWRVPFGFDFKHHKSIPQEIDGAVVVIPVRFMVDDLEKIAEMTKTLKWALFILTSDEESLFDWKKFTELITIPKYKIWIMTPRSDKHFKVDSIRYIGEGWPQKTREILKEIGYREKKYDWSFSGQITHERRYEMVQAIRDVPNGLLNETKIFGSGMGQEEYLSLIAQTKFIPCPSGPVTQDSFRFYEALEAGCIPIADKSTPNHTSPDDYWNFVFGEKCIFPIISTWNSIAHLLNSNLSNWRGISNKIFAWWQQYKRQLVMDIHEDIYYLSGSSTSNSLDNSDRITVLIPTSPILSHPDTSIIEETIKSIRDRLPDSEIIIMFDGIRDEQTKLKDQYEEYIAKMLWKCNFEYKNILPIVFDKHRHQGGMTREALKHVKTGCILFIEHDTPLMGDIPFSQIIDTCLSGELDMVRLHYDFEIHKDHKHLMLDDVPVIFNGEPFIRTIQWSQRPHVAGTEFYRRVIGDYFGEDSCTMIEDLMHGVVQNFYYTLGEEGWKKFKLGIYHPEGNIQRSANLDGRGSEPKFDMKFAYDGNPPEGAPQPN